MPDITMVRHAQASFQSDNYDILSPLGADQARWLGDHCKDAGLRFDRVVHGTLNRHRETVRHLVNALERNLPIAEDARFDELDYDALQDAYLEKSGAPVPATREEVFTLFPKVFAAWESNSLVGLPESFTAFRTRISEAIDEIMAGTDHVLVVTSNGVISAVIRDLLGLDTRRNVELMLTISNSSMHRISGAPGRMRLELFNACPHLDRAGRARTIV